MHSGQFHMGEDNQWEGTGIAVMVLREARKYPSPTTDASQPQRLLCCSLQTPAPAVLLRPLLRARSPWCLHSWLSCFLQAVTWQEDLPNHLWTAPHPSLPYSPLPSFAYLSCLTFLHSTCLSLFIYYLSPSLKRKPNEHRNLFFFTAASQH